jgi:mannosyl-oligosaccharide alpha-1,2-mannosidase
MVGIASKILGRSDLDIAEKLTEGCVWAYDSAKIMPEISTLVKCTNCTWNIETWHKAVRGRGNVDEVISQKGLPPGFADINDGRYILRPEAIESIFIMYRITGDRKWQDKAWNIENATRTEIAYASLEDVSQPTPKQVDKMESFWTAETLKYFYLTFSKPDLISLDNYVFNTEAHPFRRQV